MFHIALTVLRLSEVCRVVMCGGGRKFFVDFISLILIYDFREH